MKMKHYRAPDMRRALQQVREAQGADAVILSSRKIAGGVEVVAAIDFEVEDTGVDTYAQESLAARGLPDTPESYPNEEERRVSYASFAGSYEPDEEPMLTPRQIRAAAAAPVQRATRTTSDRVPASRSQERELPREGESSAMSEELRTLRQMLETQLATLAWNDLSRRSPLQTELLKQLTQLGIASDLAGELVATLPSKFELPEAHRMALAQLSRRITCIEERWLDKGGFVAMVGPTGVGKTTLIAKLAARWVMRH
ncbi:MAG: flagellar biosynthesis protein FlhF, partial [Povalibacter sp.]